MTRIITILLLTTNFCFGQGFKSGLILPDFRIVDENEVCCIFVPKDGFNVYDSPKGQKIGTFIRLTDSKQDDQAPYKLYLYKPEKKVRELFELSNFQEIGYEIWALTFIDRKDGFIQVIGNKSNYWLEEKEIAKKGFKTETWQNFLFEKVGDLLGFYAKDPGLNLREKPDTNSKIISTLKGDLFEITPTAENIGGWTKVKVKKYREHPCSSDLNEIEIIEFELEGWIKIVDDNGQPNVWYYSRGC